MKAYVSRIYRTTDGCYYAAIEDEKGESIFVNDYMKKKL